MRRTLKNSILVLSLVAITATTKAQTPTLAINTTGQYTLVGAQRPAHVYNDFGNGIYARTLESGTYYFMPLYGDRYGFQTAVFFQKPGNHIGKEVKGYVSIPTCQISIMTFSEGQLEQRPAVRVLAAKKPTMAIRTWFTATLPARNDFPNRMIATL